MSLKEFDPTSALTLCNTFQLYPSDPIPPRLHGVMKAHKPEKYYPMQAILSTVATPPMKFPNVCYKLFNLV